MTDFLGDFYHDFCVPVSSTHQIFKNIFWVKKNAGNTQLNMVCDIVACCQSPAR